MLKNKLRELSRKYPKTMKALDYATYLTILVVGIVAIVFIFNLGFNNIFKQPSEPAIVGKTRNLSEASKVFYSNLVNYGCFKIKVLANSNGWKMIIERYKEVIKEYEVLINSDVLESNDKEKFLKYFQIARDNIIDSKIFMMKCGIVNQIDR